MLVGCAARHDWSVVALPRLSARSTLPVAVGEGAPNVSVPLPALIVMAYTVLVHAAVATPLLSR